MAVNSSSLNVTQVDFEDISTNLKEFLKGQSTLKDYDFEGSTLAILIDLMAYNSHISAFNTNLAASELFLDSAQLRKNVISRAKELGYVPTSFTGSSTQFDMSMLNVRNANGSYPSLSEMTLTRGSRFTTVFDGSTYNFVVTSSVTPTQNGSTYLYSNINLKQGTYVTDSYVYDGQISNPKFKLSNQRVDVSSVSVSINSDSVTTGWTKAGDLSSITTTSKVFFTQESDDGFTEIYFGDNTIGATPLDGDIITVTYIVVDTVHANGAKVFQLIDAVNGFSNAIVTNVTTAYGGSEHESIESIKFKASKFYSSQNRLVTLNDYKAKVTEFYPNADAIAIWGGEDNDPPEYGKIFLSIKPINSDYLSENEKDTIKARLRDLNMLTVRPVIVDAEVIDIVINATFKYNPRTATVSKGELESLVNAKIRAYDTSKLNGFDAIFRHSNLTKDIDATDDSILSNVTTIKLRKALNPTINTSKGYTLNFGNAFYHPHAGHASTTGGILVTTGFKISGDSVTTHYFDDDGNGNLRRYYLSGSTRVVADATAGTIDYTTGKIVVNGIIVTETSNSDKTIHFTVVPNSYDVTATRGQLIDIKQALITVTGEADTIASGESSAGVGYTSVTSYSS
jgi:hypothetical protein